MNKLTNAAATAHALSLAAMEEASRVGQRTADIDHLFIALVLDDQTAGQVLRRLGITLDSAREAVEKQHMEQLDDLGIRTSPQPGRIVFHETAGYEWDDRAADLIRRASDGSESGDSAAVLRKLVSEPSGMIEAILRRLNTTPTAVIANLDEVKQYSDHSPQPSICAKNLSGTSAVFIPASPEQVWRLLAAPSHMPDWEPSVGAVDHAPAVASIGDIWTAYARTEGPDGKPIRVKPALATQQVELNTFAEPQFIEWRFTYPEAGRANNRRLRIDLEPAAGGTLLRLGVAWERNPSHPRRPFIAYITRPLVRFMLWTQLSQLRSGISRSFR